MPTPATSGSLGLRPKPPNGNERVFGIHAPPSLVWRHLRAEIAEGQTSERVRIQHEDPPRQIVFWVRMGWGLEVRYDYCIDIKPAAASEMQRASPYCEVAVKVTPVGLRHAIANVLALGRGTVPYLMAATEGLANLKKVAEADSAGDAERHDI